MGIIFFVGGMIDGTKLGQLHPSRWDNWQERDLDSFAFVGDMMDGKELRQIHPSRWDNWQ